MRKLIVLSLFILLAFCALAQAASKVGTFGAPNSSGTAPMEVDSDRAITVASDATLTVSGTTSLGAVSTGAVSTGALTATSAEIDGDIVVDGTIYTARILADGAIYPGRAASDPCGTLGAGYIFFNSANGQPCYCNALGVDLMLYNGSTACF